MSRPHAPASAARVRAIAAQVARLSAEDPDEGFGCYLDAEACLSPDDAGRLADALILGPLVDRMAALSAWSGDLFGDDGESSGGRPGAADGEGGPDVPS